MKACRRNREAITLLALGELEARPSRELRAHLESCEGCRDYLAEITKVTNKLAAVETESEIQTSELFHQRMTARLKATKPASAWGALIMRFLENGLNWRALVPLSGAAAVVVALLLFNAQHPEARPPAPVTVQPVAAADTEADLPPSIMNYQMAANRSLESLDKMLDREADRIPAPMPIYTASTSISIVASN